MCIHTLFNVLYSTRRNGDIFELSALLCEIVNPEFDIFLSGDFNSRTSNMDDFIPLSRVEHTSVHDIYMVDTFNILRHSLNKRNIKQVHCYQCAKSTAFI